MDLRTARLLLSLMVGMLLSIFACCAMMTAAVYRAADVAAEERHEAIRQIEERQQLILKKLDQLLERK